MRLMKATLCMMLLLVSVNSATAFSGSVTDNNGNGLPGAKVTLIANSSVYVAYSGTNGAYTLPDLPGNTPYQMLVSLHGYPAQTVSGNSNSYAEIDFVFEPAEVTLSGRVMQPDGTPIAFATIDAGALGNYVSDSDGNFSISAAVGTEYSLRVAALDMFFTAPTKGILPGNTTRVIVGDFD